MVNSVGSFLGPSIVGYLLTKGYSHRDVVFFLTSCFLISAAFVAAVRPKRGIIL